MVYEDVTAPREGNSRTTMSERLLKDELSLVAFAEKLLRRKYAFAWSGDF